ncbi:hypothetical protein [Arthrobacter oryzae]|uniref:hypothetical protein n=1 Tax=Arthrobacter oryzae TaxID=409290 RepID=UPI002861A827|nr:hypothetical protein [Arthrobacter oryzae]MDR6507753.1 hypothetical protein [Arthrobacter oryzae]
MSNRPYLDLRRAEITAKQADNNQSRAHLNGLRADLDRQLAKHNEPQWVEVKKMFGRVERTQVQPDIDHLKVTMQLTHQSTTVTQMLTELAKDDQALEFELHIRNTPELVQQFGPGAD